MIAGLKAYPSLKESGVPWLGGVPAHWEVRKLRSLLEPVTERNRPDLPLLSVVREKGVIRRDTTNKDENRNFIPDDLGNYKVVVAEQFAVNKMKAWQGSYGVSQHDGIVSPAYFVFAVSGVASKFFHSAIRSRAYVSFFAQASDGVRIGQWDLSQARMKEIPFFVPPLPEQAAIVRFLVHGDRQIRRYIRTKQKLIELLEEQKQATIHRAVTRGLDPNARLRPSGVEWLGDVPELWELRRVRSCLVDSRTGTWGSDPTEDNKEDHVICVRVADFNIGRLRVAETKLTVRAVSGAARASRLLEMGDILLEKSGGGEAEPVGRVVLFSLGIPAISSNFITRLRPDRSLVEPEFLLNVLAAMQATRRNVPCIKQTTGIQNLDEREYLSYEIAVPPLHEQRHLLTELGTSLAPITLGIGRANAEVDLLYEYRTRLFADVVTGKLDVREAAAALPHEIDEEEPLQDEVEMVDADDESDREEVGVELEEVEA